MTSRTKKLLFDGMRLGFCALALGYVIRGVELNDRVVLKDGARQAYGDVSLHLDTVVVRYAGGGSEALPLASVAVDANGAPRIAFGLQTTWRNSAKHFLVLAVVAFSAVPLLQAMRIRGMLRAQRIDISCVAAIRLSFAGNFLNFAAPLGSTAGDVFKAYYLSLHTNRKTEAMTLVLLDRVIGLGTLVLVVSLISILSPADSRLAPLRMYMLVVPAAGICGLMIYLSPAIRGLSIVRRIASRLPLSEHLIRVDRTAVALAANKPAIATAVATTVVLQMFAAAAFIAVATAIGMTVGTGNLMEYYAYFSTGEVIKALPGPPQGLGTMELAYAYFFAPFASASQIICAAFAIRLVMLICSLPGLLITMTGACKPATRALHESIGMPALQPE